MGRWNVLLGLMIAMVLGVVEGAAGACCTAVPSSGPRALVVLADSLVLGGGLRLRGGGGSSGGEDVDASMRDGGGKDEAPAQSSADLDEDSDEVAGITVPVTIQSTCFGRNDFFNVSVEPTMLVKDLKRELYANFSSQVCDSEQMELWWAGKELKGLSSDSLRSYGFGRELTRILVRAGMRERMIVRHKFMFSSQFAGEATKRQQQRGGAHLGLGGQQAQVAAMHNARMQELLQNPAELQRLMQSPEFQQILASNPEVGEILKDPEMLRRTMRAASDPATMRSMLEQQDRMLFNILAQPGGANALKRMTREAAMGGAGGGGGLSDGLIEKIRQSHLSAEQDEEIKSMARLSGQELAQVLQQLPPDKRAALLRARETLLRSQMGYDRVRFKDAVAANSSLAREYGLLHRRFGNMQELRRALTCNATLAEQHASLAALLRTSPAMSSPLSSSTAGGNGGVTGQDFVAAAAGGMGGMLSSGRPQTITNEHMQEALKMAMGNSMGNNRHPIDAQPLLESASEDVDMDAMTYEEKVRAGDAGVVDRAEMPSLAPAPGTPQSSRPMTDAEKLNVDDERLPDEQDLGTAEAHKQALLDLCSRDHLALASMALLLQGLASQKTLSPEALGPLQDLCSSESSEEMLRELAMDAGFMQRILELARQPEFEQALRQDPALSHIQSSLVLPPPSTEVLAAGAGSRFKAVYSPQVGSSADDKEAQEEAVTQEHAAGQGTTDVDGERQGQDVNAPVIARERQKEGWHEPLDGQRIGGRSPLPPPVDAVTKEQGREQARALVEGGNEAIAEGSLLKAATLFEQAHLILKQVEGPSSAAAHKTKALAAAMARKVEQLQRNAPRHLSADAQGGNGAGRSRSGAEGAGREAERRNREASEDAMEDAKQAALQPSPSARPHRMAMPSRQAQGLSDHALGQHSAPSAPWWVRWPGAEATEAGPSAPPVLTEEEKVMFQRHLSTTNDWRANADNGPAPADQAVALDEPPREGEDADRAAARQWLAHRHDCTVISQRIIRKMEAKRAFLAAHADKAAMLGSHVVTSPPDLALFYQNFNHTELREALDAPELDYRWVLAHKEDQELLRKEQEELDQEDAQQRQQETEAITAPNGDQEVSPREKYAAQLEQLKDMGFPDEFANLEALIDTGGSVENAISRLFE